MTLAPARQAALALVLLILLVLTWTHSPAGTAPDEIDLFSEVNADGVLPFSP